MAGLVSLHATRDCRFGELICFVFTYIPCSMFILVLVLFGILPAAMSWSDRQSKSITSMKLPKLVPGGHLTLAVIGGGAGWVILSELLENLGKT